MNGRGESPGRGAIGLVQRPDRLERYSPATQTEMQVIRAKLGLLELAKQLGNVIQTCRVLGYRIPPG
jgi:hypothetical protein